MIQQLTSIPAILVALCLGVAAALADQTEATEDGRESGPLGKDVEAMLKIGVPEGADAPEDRNVASNPLPNVLLIGDSISGGYLAGVQAQLKNAAHVERGSNGGTTISGLENIDKILGDTKWDIIHFNWGLHDMTWQRRMKPEERGIKAYAERLEQLVRRLTQTNAKLVWATTTPWPGNYAYYEHRFGEKLVYSPKQEHQWSAAALAVMKKHDIPVNDLYALLKPELAKYQKPDDVHFNNEGSQVMARQIASTVRPLLPKRNEDSK